MELGTKAAVVLILMIVVGVLTIIARRRNYEGLRRRHTMRRTRVSPPGGERGDRTQPDGSDQEPKT